MNINNNSKDLKLSDNEIIVERSENSSTDKKASSNLNANVNNVKMSNSCILSNKFVSMKSKIENFFTKRSCEVILFFLKKNDFLKNLKFEKA